MESSTAKKTFFLLLAAGWSLFSWEQAARAQKIPPTLVTITIDGDMSDWQAVLQNPTQVSHDGYGSNIACAYSDDRDCPVGNGVGRDLLTFAWTYDSENVYHYVERFGSTNNNIYFFFIMDLDGNGLAESTDVVFEVHWYGQNQRTDRRLLYYQPLDPGGDPLVDANGFADGYDMPGTLGALIKTYPTGVFGGSPSGLGFEAAVPWADLPGVAWGAPIMWHVSSANGTPNSSNYFPVYTADNLGDPSGGVGSFGYAGVAIEPDWVRSAASPASVLLAHRIENTGNIAGVFNFGGVSALGLALTWWSDPDGDGDPVDGETVAVDTNGDGDFLDAADTPPPPAWDLDGNGQMDALLNWGAHLDLVLQVDIPAALNGTRETVRLFAQMRGASWIRDTAKDDIFIGYVIVYPDRSGAAMAGQTVGYGHAVANNNTVEETIEFAVSSSRPWPCALYTDPNGDGDPQDGQLLAEDSDGDGDWDALGPGADSNANGSPDTGPLAPGTETGVVLVLSIPVGTPVGTIAETTIEVFSAANPARSDTALDSTRVLPRVTLEPDYTFAGGTGKYVAAGGTVYFPMAITNAWPAPDSFNLAAVSNLGWTVRLWSDPNGNGGIEDGEPISSAGPVAGNGGVYHLVVELLAPAGTPAGTRDTVTVTATSMDDPASSDDALAEADVHFLESFRDNLYMFSASRFATCETMYLRASGLAADTVDRYQVVYVDPSANPAGSVTLVTDFQGHAHAQRTFAAAEPLGVWTVQLWDLTGPTLLDSLPIVHERSGAIDPFTVQPALILSGDDLLVAARLQNTSVEAFYSQGELLTRVLSPAGEILLPDGTWTSYTGSETSRSDFVPYLAAGQSYDLAFAFNDVVFPQTGDFTVEARWNTFCGAEIVSADRGFYVDVDTDGDGVPDTLDNCPLHYNPSQDLSNDDQNCGACGNVCPDADFCNGVETCISGSCQAGAYPCGAQLCDEDNDACVDCLTDNDCANADFCDGAETCVSGACQDGTYPCGTQLCDENTDACVDCLTDNDCANADFCDGAETCVSGACQAGTYPCGAQLCDENTDACVNCLTDNDCNDGNVCTDDSCNPSSGECLHVANSVSCDDSNACTENDACSAGVCSGTAVSCDDSDACTTDGCDTQTGCTHAAVVCDDSDLCTTDGCDAQSGCVFTPVNCDDANVCTDDSCNPSSGECLHVANSASCDDGLFCNGVEACSGGACQAGEPPCPARLCDEDADTCHECSQDSDCDDGSFCNGSEFCSAGSCQAGSAPCPAAQCDEENDTCRQPCTDSDGDGKCDEEDPCPRDANDYCTIWQGSHVSGGGCACGTEPGTSVLTPALILGIPMCRRRRRD